MNSVNKTLSHRRRGEPCDLEPLIEYLQADEIQSGSGGLKKTIWRELKKASLTEQQKSRLRFVALHSIRGGFRYEFWAMCECMSKIQGNMFLAQVTQIASSSSGETRIKAKLLLACVENSSKIERLRHEFKGVFSKAEKRLF